MTKNKTLGPIAAACLAATLALTACSSAPPAQQPAPPPPAPPEAAAPEATPVAVPAAAESAAATDAAAALTASIGGKLSYRTKQALPQAAVIRIQLLEVSAAGVTKLIGEQAMEAAGKQVPIEFKVAYDPKAIVARNRYQLSARIEVDGEPLMASTGTNRVITGGNPKSRNLVLQAVPKKK